MELKHEQLILLLWVAYKAGRGAAILSKHYSFWIDEFIEFVSLFSVDFEPKELKQKILKYENESDNKTNDSANKKQP